MPKTSAISGQAPPTVRFDNLADAVRCAETMMERIGHGTMYIMRAVGGIETLKRTKFIVADKERRKVC